MAERIVSPGVFTRERDLSFLPQGIASIGACIIGPTVKGPAFLPTLVRNFAEYEEVFGSTDKRYYTPYTVEQYLRSAGSVTVVRVLDLTGYTADYIAIREQRGSVTAESATGSFIFNAVSTDIDVKTHGVVLTDSDGTSVQYIASGSREGFDDAASNKFYFGTGSAANMAESMSLLITNSTASLSEGTMDLSASFNGATASFFQLTVGSAGNTIITETSDFGVIDSQFAGGIDAANAVDYISAVLAPSKGGSDGTIDLSKSILTSSGSDARTIIISGSNLVSKGVAVSTWSFQLDDQDAEDYIGKVFGSNAQAEKGKGAAVMPVYLYKNFAQEQKAHNLTTGSLYHGTLDFDTPYSEAETPVIVSEGAEPLDLFKVKTRSHGLYVNNKYFVGISNIKDPSKVADPEGYGTFTLGVYSAEYGINFGNLIENWDNCNFDPTHQNYLPRLVGDRYATIGDGSGGTINGKIYHHGDWPNRSKHIYIDPDSYGPINEGSYPKETVPWGHKAVQTPLSSTETHAAKIPTASFITNQSNTNDTYDSSIFYGVDLEDLDNRLYLGPTNGFHTGSNADFSLGDMKGSDGKAADEDTAITLKNSDTSQRQFSVPFQGGYDGDNPAESKLTGADITTTNVMGFDCSGAKSSGSVAYKRALGAISNPDEFDVNMIITPGIIHGLHSKVSFDAISVCENRGDCFYIVDPSKKGDSIATAISRVETMDTNYTATYYPWVKIVDRVTSLPVWVPPSVVLPGVIAYTDQVAHEWFAPAGLNRGGLTTVLEAETRLTHLERDSLYEERINPIASFPGQGVVVWGQKTLQARPSALDRVNVRRLLIKLKKFIASSSRYLLFEQNNSATRARFLNIVNPFLESVQQNSGLSAFKVVMDDSNNTPDVIDRNQLVGQIFIQPTRTAEFIVLDFVVLPTGAAFPS